MVKKILISGAEAAILNHEKSWEKFWSTSGVALADKDFQNWWYRQLYYFRCFSKSGVIPMGLQAGVDKLAGWHGSYKINSDFVSLVIKNLTLQLHISIWMSSTTRFKTVFVTFLSIYISIVYVFKMFRMSNYIAKSCNFHGIKLIPLLFFLTNDVWN